MENNTANVKKRSFLAKIFAEPDAKTTIKDPEKIRKKYKWLQPAIFTSLYLLYFSSYLGRKQLAIGFNGAPGSGNHSGIEDLFGLGTEVYSTLGMIYYFCYAIGKFLGGVLADKANVRVCLPLSVAVSSIFPLGIVLACNLFSNGSVSTGLMIAIMYISWGLAGFIQSASFPMCGKTLTFWYSNKNRARIWSFWSTSHELGSAASLGLATFLITKFDWQAVFYIPALISVSVSILAFILLRDKPVSVGLPDVETYAGTAAAVKESEEEDVDTRSQWQVFTQEILGSKTIWILGLAFISVYIMRVGPTDWLPKMLENDTLGAIKSIIVPACGCLGTLSIPWVSEKIFKGRRAPAIFVYFLVATLCFIGLRLICSIEPGVDPIISLPENVSTAVQLVLYALLGVATYGPLVMIGGVASIESASKRVAAAATGFTGAMGYIGAILMSFLGRYKVQLGNSFIYNIWIVSGIVAMILILLLWNQKANKEYSH